MWWEKSNHLRIVNNRLFIGEYDVVTLTEEYGSPVYIYNLNRIKDNYIRMADALEKAGFRKWRIHYAMKANNNREVLRLIRRLGGGIDATSPGEVRLAIKMGFKENDIIFTGTSLSNSDLEFLAQTNILINFDSISSIRRFNSEDGRRVGLRINTGIGIGRVEKTTTGGSEVGQIPIKFGISGKAIDVAFDLIESKGFELYCLHHHVGSDWVGSKIEKYFQALDNLLKVVERAEMRFGKPVEVLDLGGGYRRKTLNLTVAPSHGGKSSLLIADACNFYLNKEEVLFISLEMTEFEIARRVDANLLNHSANDLGSLSEEEYTRRLNEIKQYAGKLVIKEYPAGTFNTIKLKALLNELSTQGFNPSVIIIDYIGLMSSSRVSLAQAGGMYQFYKSIAEELHGFAKEYNVVVNTASQLNRGAYNTLDAGLDSIADSLGVIQTADTVLAILSNDALREENKALLKFLKNRNTGKLSSNLVEVRFDTMTFIDYDEQSSTIDRLNTNIGSSSLQESVGTGVNTSVMNFN